MITTGTLVEVGKLEDEGGALGFVIKRTNGEFVTVKGLTIEEARVVALHLLQTVSVTVDRETPP
jgi:hypothetical protein